MKKITSTILGGLFIAASTTGTALATITFPKEGGTWVYGTYTDVVYSNYKNSTPRHSTSVDGKSGMKRSACAGKDKWATVSDTIKASGSEAFYRNSCP